MATKIPLGNRIHDIRTVLIQRATEGRTIFYGELGQAVGVSARGPWKQVLDEIARQETDNQRPDVTYLVINKQTGLPGQIGFEPAKPPTPEQRKKADEVIKQVFDYYRKKRPS